jgi:hypothetical protein
MVDFSAAARAAEQMLDSISTSWYDVNANRRASSLCCSCTEPSGVRASQRLSLATQRRREGR